MRVLITGVNGFIGQHLAKELLARGHAVVGLDRAKESGVRGLAKYHSGSVLDKAAVKGALIDVDAVVHLAALTTHKEITEQKFATLELNFLGTKNALDAFAESAAKKFVYSSTGKVYGKPVHLPIS